MNGFMNFLSFDSNGHPSQAIYDVINYQGNRLKKVAPDNSDSFSEAQIFWTEHFSRHAIITIFFLNIIYLYHIFLLLLLPIGSNEHDSSKKIKIRESYPPDQRAKTPALGYYSKDTVKSLI